MAAATAVPCHRLPVASWLHAQGDLRWRNSALSRPQLDLRALALPCSCRWPVCTPFSAWSPFCRCLCASGPSASWRQLQVSLPSDATLPLHLQQKHQLQQHDSCIKCRHAADLCCQHCRDASLANCALQAARYACSSQHLPACPLRQAVTATRSALTALPVQMWSRKASFSVSLE